MWLWFSIQSSTVISRYLLNSHSYLVSVSRIEALSVMLGKVVGPILHQCDLAVQDWDNGILPEAFGIIGLMCCHDLRLHNGSHRSPAPAPVGGPSPLLSTNPLATMPPVELPPDLEHEAETVMLSHGGPYHPILILQVIWEVLTKLHRSPRNNRSEYGKWSHLESLHLGNMSGDAWPWRHCCRSSRSGAGLRRGG